MADFMLDNLTFPVSNPVSCYCDDIGDSELFIANVAGIIDNKTYECASELLSIMHNEF